MDQIFGAVLGGEIGARNAFNTGFAARMGLTMQGRRQAERRVVATIVDDVIAAGDDIRQMGQNAEAWYRANLIGQTVTNRETGMKVQFNVTGAKKIGVRKGETLYRIVPAIRDIIEKGSLIETRQDRVARNNVRAVHKIGGRVMLDGKPRDVVLTVRELTDGTFHYDLSRDVSDGARFQQNGQPAMKAGSGTDSREPNPVELNIDEIASGFKESGARFQRAARAVRPLTAQGRAHRNTGMHGALFMPDRRVWEELTRAGAPIWQRLRGTGGAESCGVERARFWAGKSQRGTPSTLGALHAWLWRCRGGGRRRPAIFVYGAVR